VVKLAEIRVYSSLPRRSLHEGRVPFVIELSFPSTHYVNFAQGIFYRGAGIEIVWRSFAAITAIGLIFFAIALLRFRRTVAIT